MPRVNVLQIISGFDDLYNMENFPSLIVILALVGGVIVGSSFFLLCLGFPYAV